jgi:hypothetical protein
MNEAGSGKIELPPDDVIDEAVTRGNPDSAADFGDCV